MRDYLPLKIHVIVFDQVPIFMLLSRNIILFLVCIIGLGTMVLFRNFLEVISYFKKVLYNKFMKDDKILVKSIK